MPKKGKGKKGKRGKKGGKGKKGTGEKKPKLKKVPDGLSPSEMTKGQLLGFIKRLLVEKDNELMERNLFMLEKNKLWALWQVTMDKVKVLRDEARLMNVKLDKAEKEKEKEREMFNHKLRHLQNEEVKNFGFIRLGHLKYMKKVSDEIWEIESILRESALAKKQEIRKAIASYYEILRSLRLKHTKSISDMLKSLSKAISFYEKAQDRKFFVRKSAWEDQHIPQVLERRNQMFETQETMNTEHERFLMEMKTYFDDVTTNNLAVMSMLSREIDLQKLTENRLKRDLHRAKTAYLNVHEPLQKMTEEMKERAGEKANIGKLHYEVQKNENIRKKKDRCLHLLEVTLECMREQLRIAKIERDKARLEFSKIARKMQSRAQMKYFVMRLKARTAQKDSSFFQSIIQNITRPTRDSQNYFDNLLEDRCSRMRVYCDSTRQDMAAYGLKAKALDCYKRQQQVELKAKGKVNNKGVIPRPWPVPEQDNIIDYGTSHYKDIVNPKNVLHTLPKHHYNSIRKSPEPVSNPSTASIVNIYSKPPVENLRASSVIDVEIIDENLTTKEKLERLMKKGEDAGSLPDPQCDFRLPPPAIGRKIRWVEPKRSQIPKKAPTRCFFTS